MTGTIAKVRRSYVDTSAGQMHYLTAGTGYPVILLHMTSEAATQYEMVLPELAKLGYRAVAIDLPGHGNSYRPASEPEPQDYARAVKETADALDIKRATVQGHHFGAVVAAWTYRCHPELVDRLCFYGWTRHSDELRAARLSAVAREFPADGEAVKKSWMRRWEMGRTGLKEGEPSRCTEEQALRSFIAKLQAGKNWHFAYHCIGKTHPLEMAAKIDCPVLLFAGPGDLNWQRSIDAVGDFRDARFVPMADGIGENAPEEDPASFARIISDFIGSSALAGR